MARALARAAARKRRAASMAGGLDARTVAYLAAMSYLPSAPKQTALDNFIRAGDAGGYWAVLKGACLPCLDNGTGGAGSPGLVDMKNPGRSFQLVGGNAMTFDAGLGVRNFPNSATRGIAAPETLGAAGLAGDSVHMGTYLNAFDFFPYGGLYATVPNTIFLGQPDASSTALSASIVGAATGVFSSAVASDYLGGWITERTGGAARDVVHNGTVILSDTQAQSGGFPTFTTQLPKWLADDGGIYVGQAGPNTREVFLHYGSAFGSTLAAFVAARNTLLTALGAA